MSFTWQVLESDISASYFSATTALIPSCKQHKYSAHSKECLMTLKRVFVAGAGNKNKMQRVPQDV